MPSYQVQPLGGIRASAALQPVQARLCCEQCMATLYEFDKVEPLKSRLSNMSAQGVLTLWPELGELIGQHETGCRRLLRDDG